jgi:hypothetical protein
VPPRLALWPDEATATLSVSGDFFDEHIPPEIKVVRRGRASQAEERIGTMARAQ